MREVTRERVQEIECVRMEKEWGRRVKQKWREMAEVSGCWSEDGKLKEGRSEEGWDTSGHNSNNVRSRPSGWREGRESNEFGLGFFNTGGRCYSLEVTHWHAGIRRRKYIYMTSCVAKQWQYQLPARIQLTQFNEHYIKTRNGRQGFNPELKAPTFLIVKNNVNKTLNTNNLKVYWHDVTACNSLSTVSPFQKAPVLLWHSLASCGRH